ncbi:MAG: hypothetical protein HY652_04205 [Acidobacteria bacterium]|nr:hypothetical protein [Acidobacteriota bacterium]
MKKCALILGLLVSLARPEFQFWPEGTYDASVPTPAKLLGHEIGSYLTDHDPMLQYVETLVRSSPRLQIVPYGQSYERRKLVLVVASSPDNLVRIEEIRASVARLTDPRKIGETEAREIARRIPAIAWMNYANDGNESAAFEAAIQVVYQMAAGTDPVTRNILDQLVVIVNPAHNPDSHQRYVTWFKAASVGRGGTADPWAAEHGGDWLMSTNNNHYQIDLNRDAFALSQVETRTIVGQIHHWNPQLFVDHHGEVENYFFPPFALPINANLPDSLRHWGARYGKALSDAFGKFGWSFSAREVFDVYYPGYYDSYPALNGAIGMTYETDGGGDKGFTHEREDKTVVTLKDGIHHHFIATMTTLQTTAENKEQRLWDFFQFRKTAMDEVAREPIKQFVFYSEADPDRAAELADLLRHHRIEVYKAREAFKLRRVSGYFDRKEAERNFPAGAYVVPLAQPQKRLARALLEPEAELDPRFLEEVQKKRQYNESLGEKARKLSYDFYDVTAWALPLAYGVEGFWSGEATPVPGDLVATSAVAAPSGRFGEPMRRESATLPLDWRPARYAYLLDYRSNVSAKVLGLLLQEDYKVAVARKEFKVAGKSFPLGALVVRVERNPASVHDRIKTLATEAGATVTPVDSAWTDEGIVLGSREVKELQKPRIAVVSHVPVSQTSFGAIWFLLEQSYGLDFTALRADRLSSADLSRYNVIILPHGGRSRYAEVLGKSGIEKLKQWIQTGGVLVGVKGGAAFAADEKVKLTSARLAGKEEKEEEEGEEEEDQGKENEEKKPEKEKPEEKKPEETKKTAAKKPLPIPGAVLRVKLDTNHFMSLGYGPEVAILNYSDLAFSKSTQGINVGVYPEKEIRLSGFAWNDFESWLGNTAYLIDEPLGRGHVILFADDPNFRLFWKGLNRLFLNSIFFAPSLD